MSAPKKSGIQDKALINARPSRTSSRKPRWHALGLGQEMPHRDPAALAFARLGLLATRW